MLDLASERIPASFGAYNDRMKGTSAFPALGALAVLLIISGLTPASAQTPACRAARAELSALDRGGVSQSRISLLNRLIAYYQSAGCDDGGAPLFARPPQCAQVKARIQRIEMELSGGGDTRREQLQAIVARECEGSISASSRPFDTPDAGSSRIIIDENGGLSPQQSQAAPLGRAMCVRSCDGFYFPLANSPGGREGADEMCQALCPASPTRAFFNDSGSMDSAIDSRGIRYASTPTAYRFRRQISSTCGCKPAGETWSTALKRAEELIGSPTGEAPIDQQNDDEARPTLRPGTSAATRPQTRRQQAIDPEPLDDEPLEPEFIPPEPRGMAVMTPKPTEPVQEAPKPQTKNNPSSAKVEGPKKDVRTVGPPVKYESGRPQPLAPAER